YSPAPVMTPDLVERTLAEIVKPAIATMAKRGAPFRGVLYAGLMLTVHGPKLIEFNVRFGDPETQAMMLRLDSDLLPLLIATADGSLASHVATWSDDAALSVVMASRGYPGAYEKGGLISGIERANALAGVHVFHAGTATRADGQLASAGGRVLNVSARGATVAEARDRAYAGVAATDFPGGFFRTDIGARALPAA
ncbi:MAG: phosphoribosylglycinamide synthetase C domain-containing protein, partial [Bauldia sp.]